MYLTNKCAERWVSSYWILSRVLSLHVFMVDNKQLLDDVEHDIMNYQNRGLCYLPKPKAEADNTDTMQKPNSIIVLLYIFSHNSSSETEAKRSAILFLRRTCQGA